MERWKKTSPSCALEQWIQRVTAGEDERSERCPGSRLKFDSAGSFCFCVSFSLRGTQGVLFGCPHVFQNPGNRPNFFLSHSTIFGVFRRFAPGIVCLLLQTANRSCRRAAAPRPAVASSFPMAEVAWASMSPMTTIANPPSPAPAPARPPLP
jgi:hypothetical protein